MRTLTRLGVLVGVFLMLALWAERPAAAKQQGAQTEAVRQAQQPQPQQAPQPQGAAQAPPTGEGRNAPQAKPVAPPNTAALFGEMLAPGPPPDPAAVARGEKLFVPTCGFCHGPDATGRSGPDLVRSPLVIRDEKGSLIGPVVHNGRPGKGMPAFPSLTDSDIADISAFLHSRIRAAANRFTYTFHEVVTGNPQAGEQYFNGPGKCATCHSTTGDLAHIASRIQPPELQAQMIYPERREFGPRSAGPSAPTERVTVTLPSGKRVSGVLLQLDEFNVSLRDASGWYRSFPVQNAKVTVEDPLAAHKQIENTITDTEMHNLLAYLETLK
jgi:cytochrome c oxidase cbb3-type subunit 3